MSIATIEIQPRVKTIWFVEEKLAVSVRDGRVVMVPLSWYPRLLQATSEERQNWCIFEDSTGRDIIFWEEIDELIPAVALLDGKISLMIVIWRSLSR